MAAKLVSVATALITVPITLHYLGAERYGMWMIMSSLVAMLSFADLGIGNGVLNTVAAAYARDDRAEIRVAVSSALAVLTLVAGVLGGAFAIAYPLVGWHGLFNVASPLARAEAGPAVAVFVACFVAAIPLGIVQRVQAGLQRGFLASCWQCVGSVAALGAVLLAVRLQAGLPWLVACFLGGPLIANLLNSIVFFGVMQPALRPARAAASRAVAAAVARTGVLFLVLQIAAAVMYNAHSIIIAQLLGAASVPAYAVPERLFSLVTMIATMALTPLWPAYREAIVRGDADWARRTLTRSILVAAAYTGALSLPLVALSPWIIRHWVDGAVAPPFMLLLGLGLWKIAEIVGVALAMFLNGAHAVKPQVVISLTAAAIAVALEIALVRAFGVAGAPWATLIAFVGAALVPYAILTPRILKRTAGGQG